MEHLQKRDARKNIAFSCIQVEKRLHTEQIYKTEAEFIIW